MKAAVAESIEGPAVRAMALLAAVDALPERRADRNWPCSIAAAAQAKAATDPPRGTFRLPMGRMAERLYQLGKRRRPRRSWPRDSACRTRIAGKTTARGRFAARLARVDLPSALAIAKQFPASGRESKAHGSSGTSP